MKYNLSRITPTERYIGHLLGPLGYAFLNFFLGSYLNVYYTDVCGLGSLWGGRFMSLYPIAVKVSSVFTFLLAGWLVDRTNSRWGRARPWILLSALLIPASAFLLFVVPTGSKILTAVAVLGSNFLFYGVAATLYATANTLMVPLATPDPEQRSQLSVTTNDWYAESGEYAVEIGASSRNIRLSGKVTVESTVELPFTYTRMSTVGDLMRTAGGRVFMQNIMAARQQRHSGSAEEESKQSMGEGSEKMVQQMMQEMPLSNLVTYGVMTFQQLDGLIAMLNR